MTLSSAVLSTRRRCSLQVAALWASCGPLHAGSSAGGRPERLRLAKINLNAQMIPSGWGVKKALPKEAGVPGLGSALY